MGRIKEILIGLIGITALLCIIELYIRGTKIAPPYFNEYIEGIGRVRKKNLDFVMFGEGFTINRFNEGRYLGPFYPAEKQKGTIRIAMLGDSYVEGFQVFDRHHFRNILEINLELFTNRLVEVMNFGRSGFDLEDIVAYDYAMVQKYNPDFTIYFLSSGDFYSSVTDQLVPNLVFKQDSVLIQSKPSDSYLKNYLKYNDVLSNTILLNMFSNARKQFKQGFFGPKIFGKFYPEKKQVTHDEYITLDINLTINDLDRIDQLLNFGNRHSNLIIVKSDTNEFKPQILEILNSNHIALINLTNPLLSMESCGIDPYYWSVTNKYGHWNHDAHAAIGEYVSKEIYLMIKNKELKSE